MFVDELIWTHGGTPKAVINRFKNGWEPIFHFTRGMGHKFIPDSVRHKSDSIPDWQGGHPCDEWNQGKGDGVYSTEKKRKARKSGSSISGNQVNHMSALTSKDGSQPDVKTGMAYPSNVLSLGKNRESVGHSAAYPTGLPAFFIEAFSDKADAVFDPFMGSGTTMIASETLDRKCYGMEISPGYCDVIVKRWQNYTGKKGKNLTRPEVGID